MMPADQEELSKLLQERMRQIEDAIENINCAYFEKIDGVKKMRTRLDAELKFLKGLENGEKQLEMKYLETSNILYLRNIIVQVEKLKDVKSVLHTFSVITDNQSSLKHTVDIVAEKGNQWVKVISRSARGILMDWLTGCSRNIFEQASDYVHCARRFKRKFVAPQVCFVFTAGVPDKMADKLERKRVIVVGERVDINSLAKIPEDFIEMLEDDSDDENSEDDSDFCEDGKVLNDQNEISSERITAVNLDVSAVFVLISNMTHEGGINHRFESKLLEDQAAHERQRPALKNLMPEIEGREWIMCRTAFESVESIMKTVSGPNEKLRWKDLTGRIRIVEDCISNRTKVLKESERLHKRNLTIFGSGDYYKATTVTANKHFLSSAYHQGVRFDAIVHESRALSEQKELPLEEK